jgi:CPA2 family monovalent cation:H+ antiporter-2
MRSAVFGIGAAELFGCAAVIGGALLMFNQTWGASLGVGLALALSSTALVLPIAGTTSPVGRSAFAMLLFEDLALVPIIFVLAALGGSGGGVGNVLLWGAVSIVAIFAVGRFILPRLFAQAARTKSPELFLAISLLVVIGASLATSAAGLSPIVGALLAGVLIAETEYHSEVEVITAPFKGLALGVFLITVGMSLNLDTLLSHWSDFVLALAAVVAVKSLVTFGLLKLSGARNGMAAETSLLMSSPSETTLIVLGTAATAGLIGAQDAAFWQTVTALGLTITPLLAELGRTVARRLEAREKLTPDLQFDEAGPGTVVIGFGRVGRMVADMLKAHGRTYVAVEADIDAVNAAQEEGYSVIFGDVARTELVDRLNLGRADALVITMDDPVLSMRLTKRIRGWVPGLTIVVRARDATHAAQLYKAGATDAVPETLESSLQLSEAVLVDLGVAMGPVIASIHEKRDELRKSIKEEAGLDREPRIRRVSKAVATPAD